MKFIFSYVKKYLKRITFGLVIKILGTIMDLLIPLILSIIIDDIIPKNNIRLVLLYGILMIICSILAMLFNVIANRMAAMVAKKTTYQIRKDLFAKAMYLEQKNVDGLSIPSLISRMTNDTYNINSMVGSVQRIGVRAPILLVGGIIITFTLDRTLTLAMLLSLPLILLIIMIVSKKGIPLYSSVQEAVDNQTLIVRENIVGSKVVRALDKTEYEKVRFNEANQKTSKAETKAGLTMAFINPSLNVVLNIGLVVVLFLGALKVYDGDLEKGKIIAFITYFTLILNALLSITRVFIMLSKAEASANRIKVIMDYESELKTEEVKYSKHYIEFKNVSFSYNNRINNLNNLTFTIEKGQSLGIIGGTGSGKSTIINLLMRFYDVTDGEIYIDYKNIKSYEKEELNNKFGVVFQSDTLFSETIFENISFGREVTLSQAEEASRDALAYEFITKNEGFSRVLTQRGTNLSGGERQRVLLSRAMILNKDILILDDSSSALDYKTDYKLRKTIEEKYKETTKIIVASRISSIAHCDKIIVLEEGNIVSIGTHEELLQNSELYQSIKKSQMGGDI